MSALAYKKNCDGCGREIFMAVCRDGRWRPFEPERQRVPLPFAWAWRKRIGMEETETVCGHLIHYCADYHDQAFRFADNVIARSEEGGRYASPKQDFRGGALHSGADTSRTAMFGEITAPATAESARWQGWGTALKPAFEPIVVGRKPLVGTVAANVLAHGTGALNIDTCRTGMREARPLNRNASIGYMGSDGQGEVVDGGMGRWPTNVLLDGSQADALDQQSGTSMTATGAEYDDQGGASRFFPTFRYEAKAPTDERPRVDGVAHPTVKPLDLMRWLVRLVTPAGGTVLEPFAGSGTTAEACVIEGFRCVAIEREAAYLPLIEARLSKPIQPDLFGGAA